MEAVRKLAEDYGIAGEFDDHEFDYLRRILDQRLSNGDPVPDVIAKSISSGRAPNISVNWARNRGGVTITVDGQRIAVPAPP